MCPDDLVSAVHKCYASLNYQPPTGHYAILAAFVVSRESSHKVCSIGTGSKVLPTCRYAIRGDSLHDSHAEVIARRGFMCWLYDEISLIAGERGYESEWIRSIAVGPDQDSHFGFRQGVLVHLYISTVPCGDASTRFIAAYQDEAMAALKDSDEQVILPKNTAARGRDNYSLYGVLRTKPGRADSPPTMCMSCSDKIAKWCALGVQGALLTRFLPEPISIYEIIIGEVEASERSMVKHDCERAFHGRLSHRATTSVPIINFTSLPFIHSRSSLGTGGSTNESLCWVGNPIATKQVLINGLKRGTSPKHRHHPKHWPLLCKASLFERFIRLLQILNIPLVQPNVSSSYYLTKQLMTTYQNRKELLMGQDQPFDGWLRSGEEWENFSHNGEYLGTVE